MDKDLIQAWTECCARNDGTIPDNFSTIFMEIYLKPLTAEDKEDLLKIFEPIPNSSRVVEKLLRLDERAPRKTDAEIIDLVKRDLDAMRPLITSTELLTTMDMPVEITVDQQCFREVSNCKNNRNYYHAITSLSYKQLWGQSKLVRALDDAFYGVAHNPHLQCALTADLLPASITFDHYFEIYFIGADYAVGNAGVTAINYRAMMNP